MEPSPRSNLHAVDDRQVRERDFHDRKYADDGPPPTAKYYDSNQRCFEDYMAAVADRCAGKRVLEYGCGEGSAAYDLAAAGARVTGIDISEVAIENAGAEARSRGVEAEFAVMDAEHLTFPPGSFDRICGSGILHHLDLRRSYGEIARCLAPDGDAIFMEPLGHNPLINAYRRFTPDLRTADEHPLRKDDLDALDAWFADVEVRYYALTSLAAVPLRSRPSFPKLLRRLERLDEALFRRVPASRRFAWYSLLILRKPRSPVPRPDGAASGRCAGDRGRIPGPQRARPVFR